MSDELSDREMKHACCLCRYLEWRYMRTFSEGGDIGCRVAVGVCILLDPPFIPTDRCGECESRLDKPTVARQDKDKHA